MSDGEIGQHAMIDSVIRDSVNPLHRLIPTLTGQRVVLRALTPDDRAGLLAIYGDSRVMRYTGEPPFASLDTVDQMLASVAALAHTHASYEWGIAITADTGKEVVIGTCSLHSFSDDRQQCEVGCLLNAQYWRQGYTRDALLVLFDHARTLGITTVWAEIDASNTASIGLFADLGFIFQGENGQGDCLYSREITLEFPSSLSKCDE
ncbi:N-acetyltransferase [Photobacterium aphoticum]|nr:N-acetyltransferase [Photobacterium aphoticum]